MRPKTSNLLWGLFFIILGVGYAGNALALWHFTILFAGWWTLFIIVPCFISIIENGANTGSILGLIIGLLLLLTQQNILDGAIIGKLIFPLILIVVGLGIMFASSFKRMRGPRPSQTEYSRMQEGNRNYSATFSGQNINCDNQVFEGANMDAIFGSVCLRLEHSIISQDVVINCNATFGGIEIFLPSDVNVRVSSTPVFGGVSNRRRTYVNDSAPVVYINATCMFGGVEIK